MKRLKITYKLLITSGVLAAIVGAFLNFALSGSSGDKVQGDKVQGDKNTMNFNKDTKLSNNNFSNGPLTIYEESHKTEKTPQKHSKSEEIKAESNHNPKVKILVPQDKQASPTSIQIDNSNIANNIIIKSENINGLVDYYNFQAGEIRNKLSHLYCFAPFRNFLSQFEVLHKKHMSALKDQNLILAAKYVERIHRLSSELQFQEDKLQKEYFKKFQDSLKIMVGGVEYLHEYEPKALHGNLANKYLTGEFNQYSVRTYDLPFPEEYASYMDSLERRNQLLKFYKALSQENQAVD